MRAFATSVVAALTMGLATAAIAVPSEAAVASHDGITVQRTHGGTVYNGAHLYIHPHVSVKSGNRQIVSQKSTAYQYGKVVKSGSSFFLAPGTYAVKTVVAYRRFVWVTKTVNVTVHHAGRYAEYAQYLKRWADNDTYTTGYTKVPAGARIYFSFSSPDSGTCYVGLDVESTDGGYKSLLDEYRRSGRSSWTVTSPYTLRFKVFSACDWALSLQWK